MTPDAAIRILQDPEVASPSMFPFKYHSSEKSPDSDTCPDSLHQFKKQELIILLTTLLYSYLVSLPWENMLLNRVQIWSDLSPCFILT